MGLFEKYNFYFFIYNLTLLLKMVSEKEHKAALKEGGKKAQDLCGMHDMGGQNFFCCVLEQCKGNLELVKIAMEGMNKDVEEGADDRKGGGKGLGKLLLSADVNNLVLLVHVPEEAQDKLKPQEWMDHVIKQIGFGESKDEGNGMISAVIPQNKVKFTNEKFTSEKFTSVSERIHERKR